MSPFFSAISGSDAAYREAVLSDTWGHLYPVSGKTYAGHIDVAVGLQDTLVTDVQLFDDDGIVLDGSPILEDHVMEFLCDQFPDDLEGKPGLYRFRVSYCWDKAKEKEIYAFTIHGKFERAKFSDDMVADPA